ncbi:hypothetical protein [uncultured Amnibacterium sp.]|uniref:COG1470 family protein n=1 Tax=uncultured Amnibacterium sp. TaxID=1631851 RepID=UPI0035CB2A70
MTAATITPASIDVTPGLVAVATIAIVNDGSVVEAYTLTVLGQCAAWTTLAPQTVSVYPGETGSVTVTITPPRKPAPQAGRIPFAVRVLPAEHPESATVPEAAVVVAPVAETILELLPRMSTGTMRPDVRLGIENRGNAVQRVVITGKPQTDGITAAPLQPEVQLAPGGMTFVDLDIRAVKRVWRGAPMIHPFSVTVEPDGGQIAAVDGTFRQNPVLPSWFGKAVVATIVAIGALVALWFALLKPQVESAAVAAVDQPLASANTAAQQAQQNSNQALQAVGQTPSPLPGQLAGKPTVSTPTSLRLQIDVPTGQTRTSDPYTVAPDATLSITDVILQNRQGDAGVLDIRVNEQIVLTFGTENYRDLDLHFSTPIQVASGEKLTIDQTCRAPGQPPALDPPPDSCDVSALFSGTTVAPVQG